MKQCALLLTLFLSSLAFAQEEKPKLHLYFYENANEKADTEVLFLTEFANDDPTTQPFSGALGLAEAFTKSSASQESNVFELLKSGSLPNAISDHISLQNKNVHLRFVFPEEIAEESLSVLIGNVANVPYYAGNTEMEVHETVKSELLEVIPFFEKSIERVSSPELNQQLFEMLPLDAVNTFMKLNFSKAESHLIFSLANGKRDFSNDLIKKLEQLNDHWTVETHSAPAIKNGNPKKNLLKLSPNASVAYKTTNTGACVVVDGKIYMDPPGWWQQKAHGMGMGIGLLVTGFLLALFTFGISFLVLGIPGIVLLSQSYLSDPSVIETKRAEIFRTGFHTAYAQQCVGIALTPFERRQLFVQEIFKRNPVYVTNKKDFAAYYALKVYNYNGLEMRQFLYSQELDQLKQFQANFYQSLSGIDSQITALNAELEKLLVPYKKIRDADVSLAHTNYEGCYAIQQREIYIKDFELAKDSIENQYRRAQISREIRDGKIRALKDNLELQLMPLKIQIDAAESILDRDIASIKARYDANAIMCKNNINFDVRMNILKKGEWEVLNYYSSQATQYILQQMNPSDSNFPDYLDLRTKK